MRILGISLWPEKLSDEQYIERIRKRVKTRRLSEQQAGADPVQETFMRRRLAAFSLGRNDSVKPQIDTDEHRFIVVKSAC